MLLLGLQESLILEVEADQFQVNTQDLSNQTLSRAASRFVWYNLDIVTTLGNKSTPGKPLKTGLFNGVSQYWGLVLEQVAEKT